MTVTTRGDDPVLCDGGLGDDPITAFQRWLEAARSGGAEQPEAMALATVGDHGPSVRMVLLRGVSEAGFRFFSNRQSRKGEELAASGRAALCFHWMAPLHRQVRVEGAVTELGAAASAEYFAGRAPQSRISAWASPQSQVVADRAALERLREATEARFANAEPPLPPFWGGYLVVPESIEFWQSREHRLHDRIRFVADGSGWRQERLAP